MESVHRFDVSRETFARLEAFVELLLKWNARINLIGRSTADQIWSRHIADSLQLVPLAADRGKVWVDLGTGGGFPGLVVAIAMAERQPDMLFHLIEADHRKATFLREAARLLEIKASVYADRIENVPAMNADIVSARALAPLSDLCPLAVRHLARGGTAFFPKGENWRAEIEEANLHWRFHFTAHQSETATGAAIIEMKDLERV